MKKEKLVCAIIGIVAVSMLYLFTVACEDTLVGPGTDGLGREVLDADQAALEVEEGIVLMKDGDWEGAYDSFTSAVINDYTNSEAIAYYTVCDIASISSDPDLQTLADDMLGMSDYPTTMNEVFVPGWLTMQVSSGIESFIGLPEINVPVEIATYDDDNAEIITIGEYLLAVAYNAVVYLTNNGGLNAIFDTVVDDLLGPRLNNAIAAIQGMPGDAKINFEYTMFSPDGLVPYWWPLDVLGDPIVITIGKAEILYEAYFLQGLKANLYMIKAYDFTLPLLDYWNNFSPIHNDYMTSPLTPVNGWGDVPSPFSTGFLYARGDAASSLATAKSAMTGAMNTIQTMVGLIQGRGTGSGFTLAEDSPISEIAGSWSYVDTALGFADVMAGKMLSSINSSSSTFIYPVDFTPFTDEFGTIDMLAYFENYANASNWPSSVDWGSFNETDGYLEGPPTAIGVNFSAVFSSPLGAINNLIALDSSGEPLWYKYEIGEAGEAPLARVASTPVSTISILEATTGNSDYLYAFKVKDITLNGLIEVDSEMYEQLKEMLLPFVGGPDYVESDFIVENSDGSIEVYVPIIQPYLAYHTFAAPDQNVSVTDLNIEMVTTGSFWFALQYQGFFGTLP